MIQASTTIKRWERIASHASIPLPIAYEEVIELGVWNHENQVIDSHGVWGITDNPFLMFDMPATVWAQAHFFQILHKVSL